MTLDSPYFYYDLFWHQNRINNGRRNEKLSHIYYMKIIPISQDRDNLIFYRFIINLESGNKKTKNYTGDCSLLDCQKNLPIRTERKWASLLLSSTAHVACLIKFLQNLVFANAKTASSPLSPARLCEPAIAKKLAERRLRLRSVCIYASKFNGASGLSHQEA